MEDHDVFLLAMAMIIYWTLPLFRIPHHVRPFTGNDYIRYIMSNENPQTSRNVLRMGPGSFQKLMSMLLNHGLQSTRVSAHEKAAAFLNILGHGAATTTSSEFWQHSSATMHRHFYECLKAFSKLVPKYIRMPRDEDIQIHPKVKDSARFSPWFDNCIGAIDGTKIPVHCLKGEQAAYMSYKGALQQNVLAVVDLDTKFLYVLAGWEGTCNDSRMLEDAIGRGFKIPENKFILGDAGFPLMRGLLTPFRSTLYHIQEYDRTGREPQNARELYNYRHSGLRMCIERAFGVLKARFQILKLMRRFPMKTQAAIVMICCALHNFLLEGVDDDIIEEEVQEHPIQRRGYVPAQDRRSAGARHTMAEEMWADYCTRRVLNP